jgi:hypothetical protein
MTQNLTLSIFLLLDYSMSKSHALEIGEKTVLRIMPLARLQMGSNFKK